MSTRHELEHVYRLIQHDRIYDAQAVLRPILLVEPDNVHAWWLMAYASTDPDEVRRALTAVLALDPDYVNAPRAREMLAQLNMLYPADEADQVMPASMFTLEDDAFEELLAEVAEAEELSGAPDDIFAAADVAAFGDERFDVLADDVDLEGQDDVLWAPETVDESAVDEELDAMLAEIGGEEEILEIAHYEDEPPPPQRSAAWLAVLAAVLIVGLAVLVGLFILLRDDGEPETAEPAALTMLLATSERVVMARAAAEADLAASPLGERGQTFVAQTSLGRTFFVQFCSRPTAGVASNIMAGMALAARHGSTLAGEVEAVGVSVLLCDQDRTQTLYRAVVPLDQASRFVEGGDSGEVGLARFQESWRTP